VPHGGNIENGVTNGTAARGSIRALRLSSSVTVFGIEEHALAIVGVAHHEHAFSEHGARTYALPASEVARGSLCSGSA
jgi:hypothetical protein